MPNRQYVNRANARWVQSRIVPKKKVPPAKPEVRAFGARVAEARRALGLTQQQLDALSGVGQTSISHLEGGNKGLDADGFIRLATELGHAGARLEFLFWGEKPILGSDATRRSDEARARADSIRSAAHAETEELRRRKKEVEARLRDASRAQSRLKVKGGD